MKKRVIAIILIFLILGVAATAGPGPLLFHAAAETGQGQASAAAGGQSSQESQKASEEAEVSGENRKASEEAEASEENRKASEEAKVSEKSRKASEEAEASEESQKASEKAKVSEESQKASEKAEDSGDETETGETQETITLTIYDKNSSGTTFTDPVAQEIMKRTGVKIEVMDASNDPDTELELMLNQKSYPDIVLMSQGDMVNRYIETGAFISLDVLLIKYGQDIEKMYGSVLEESRYSDGNIHWLANWYGSDYDASAGVLMRRDLLEEIAGKARAYSNAPFTMSEYKELLRKFKEKYPTLEGEESIALELDYDMKNYETSMTGMQGLKTYVEDEEGNLHYAPTTQRYEDELLYLNELYREGLIDKEWLISKTDRCNEKLAGGYVFSIWASYWDTDDANALLTEKYGEDSQFYCYKVMADDLTADQTTYNARNSLGWDAIGITDNCQYPDEAMKVLNFLASEEGQYLMLWGVEGQTWNYQGETHVPDFDFMRAWKSDSALQKAETGVRKWTWMIKNGNGSDNTPYDLTTKYATTELVKFANASFSQSDYWDTALYSGLEPSIRQDLGVKWIKVTQIYEDSFKDIVCASTEEDAGYLYDKMITDMKLAGLEECEEYITNQYNKKIKKWK